MSQLGNYKLPDELKNEDKWLKYFNPMQMAAVLVTVAIDIGIIFFSYKIHLLVVGITLAIFILLAVLVSVMITMPNNRYLFGGGIELYKLVFRVIRRKLFRRNKVIYTFLCDEEEDGEYI